MAQHTHSGCENGQDADPVHCLAQINKRAKTPTMTESLEMQALSDAMMNVAAPASEIVKLFVNKHNLDFGGGLNPLGQHHQCTEECVSTAVDQETEAVLREMAKTCQQYTEIIRHAFERLRIAGSRSPGASGSDAADDIVDGGSYASCRGNEGGGGDSGGRPTRTYGPNALAAMSEETRNALLKLSLPLITDPSQASAAIQAADIAEHKASKHPLGSNMAIEFHGRAMAFRSLAYGIRSGPVARSQHELGLAFLAAGLYDDAAKSLRSSMRARDEFELDGDQYGTREEAAFTREVYGRTMEAKGDFEEARAVRMEGLEWGRIRCGADDCHALLAAYNLSSCGACRSVFYCSVECQTTDWVGRHKRLCKKYTARCRRKERLAQTVMPAVAATRASPTEHQSVYLPHPKPHPRQQQQFSRKPPQTVHQEGYHVSQPSEVGVMPDPPIRKGKRKNR